MTTKLQHRLSLSITNDDVRIEILKWCRWWWCFRDWNCFCERKKKLSHNHQDCSIRLELSKWVETKTKSAFEIFCEDVDRDRKNNSVCVIIHPNQNYTRFKSSPKLTQNVFDDLQFQILLAVVVQCWWWWCLSILSLSIPHWFQIGALINGQPIAKECLSSKWISLNSFRFAETVIIVSLIA